MSRPKFALFAGLLIALVTAISLPGCSSAADDAAASANAMSTRGGAADGSSASGSPRTTLSATYAGNPTANNTEVSRTTQDSQAGDVQMAFNFGAVTNAQEALGKAIAADPVIEALKKRITRLEAAQPVDEATLDQATAALAQRLKDLQEALVAAGGSLPSLQHLTVVNISRKGNGTPPPPIGPDEAKEISEGLRAIHQK